MAASGAATGARQGFSFDPASTLGWAVPLTLIAPLAAFALAATSVRTRRSAANMAMLGAVVALLATLLTAWGLAKKTAPFIATHRYFNFSVAFSGPPHFQGFGIDIILRVDHLTAIALLVVELCVIGALAWHRVLGRSEPGPARFHALVSVFLFGALATLMSWDLAELLAFWGLAGAVTYLLLAQRWSAVETARNARVALALPFFTDLSLLCGVAVLYSRYGVQDLTQLVPILHNTPGAGVRTLVVASILLGIGIAGRLALWPVHQWVTRTATSAPPAASAMAQSVWSVVGIAILYRLMPIIGASNTQTLRAFLYAFGVAAVVGPLLALFGNEPRRALALAGTAVAAVGAAVIVRGSADPHFTFAVTGVACVLAAAPARAAGVLAMSAVVAAMRTDDMAEMGEAWRRMRLSSLALLTSGLVVALSVCGALAYSIATRSRLGVVIGEAVLLVGIAWLRVFFAVATGPLRRRRAFEPDRVREAPPSALSWLYWLTFGGAVLGVASLTSNWLGFLDARSHPAPALVAYLLWAGIVVAGLVATAAAFVAGKDSALRVSAKIGKEIDRTTAGATGAFYRFIFAPLTDIAERLGGWVLEGDGAIARAAAASGRGAVAAARVPAPAVLLLVAILLALAVGLLAPGVYR